jgi:hypothetical protein
LTHAIISELIPTSKNLNFIEIDFNELEKYGKRKTRTEFIDISDKIIGNKKLNEWFEVNGISLWWFVFPTIYPICNDAGYFIDCLESFIDKNKITSMELKSGFDKLDLIKQICFSKKIKLKINNFSYTSFLIKQYSKNKIKKFAHAKITSTKHQKRLKKYEDSKKFKLPSDSYTIITSPGLYRRDTYDVKTKKNTTSEIFIEPFLNILQSQNEKILCVDLDYTFKGDLDSLSERLESNFDWIPVELFLSLQNQKNLQKDHQQLKNSIKLLLEHDMTNLFYYHGISIWNYVKLIFEQIFYDSYIPTYLRLIYGLEDYFKKNKPKQIIQVYETGPYAKVFEVIAKKLEIKTIGIQHGMWATINPPEYLHKNIQNAKNPLGHPIPDLTCVFGEYDKKLLVEKGNYPSEKIMISGNLSLFNLNEIKESLNKNSITKKYDISNKQIILVPLSFRMNYPKKNRSEIILLNHLFSNFKDDSDKLFLVRPHPGDKFNQQTLSKICPSKNFICSKLSLFEDIFVSDLIVLTYSSVGLEATLFNKPVFYVSVSKNESSNFSEYYEPFIKNGVIETIPIDNLNLKIDKQFNLEFNDISTIKQNTINYFFNKVDQRNLKNILTSN